MIGSGLAPEQEGQTLLDSESKAQKQAEVEPDYSSVVTQVTKRDPIVPPPVLQTFNLHHAAGPNSPNNHASRGTPEVSAANPLNSPSRGGVRSSTTTAGSMGGAGSSGSSSSSSSSWRSRFRSLLCCFVPDSMQHGGYIKSKDLQGSNALSAGHGAADAAGAGGAGSNGTMAAPYLTSGGSGVNSLGSRFMGVGGISPMIPMVPMSLRQRDDLIGPKRQEDLHKKTLVLDLDETLVHSSFKPIPRPDYIIPVEIEGKLVDVYVLKRPWLDHFMESVGHRFEVVVFTASLSKYADPLLDLLDKDKVVRWRLFRDACLPYEGSYVKDLACLGRELPDTIIVDNSPHSYVFQPANALPIGTFIDNMEDQELLDLLPVLQQTEAASDVRAILQEYARALGAQGG